MSQGNFHVGDVSGIGHAIGHNAQSSVRMGTQQTAELTSLIAELRQAIANAPIPDTSKQIMLDRTIPAMEPAPVPQATGTDAAPAPAKDPKEAVRSGLERISDQLEGVGAAGEHIVKIAEIAKKMAGVVGVGLSIAAPFLARVIGR